MSGTLVTPPRPYRSGPRGFGLLELVLVLIIVSVLLGTWASRFRAIQQEAHGVMLVRLASHMRFAAEIFHLQCQAQSGGGQGARCGELTVGQVRVVGQHQYPEASIQGIGRLAGLTPGEPAAEHFEVRQVQALGVAALSVRVRPLEEGGCELLYMQATAWGQAPSVSLSSVNCQ